MIASLLSRINRNPHKKTLMLNVRHIIKALSVYIGERHIGNERNLSRAASYIAAALRQSGAELKFEKYKVQGCEVANIIAEIRGDKLADEIIVIGAHYDTVEGSVGANDNASGVAALIEIYRLLSRYKSGRTLRFVAFTLEEPPHFSTSLMGSYVHALGCKKRKENIVLMISLDMLGCGSIMRTQSFPHESMQTRYPQRADYLAVAALPSNSQYAYLFKKAYNRHARKKIYDVVAPASIAGINDSDHSSFHKCGFPAILVTDTGVYRNGNYHTGEDSFTSVNFGFLADNILNIFRALQTIASLKKL